MLSFQGLAEVVRPVASVFRFSSEEVAIKAVQTMNGSLFAGMRLGVNFSRFEWPYKVRRKEVYELERKKVASFPLTGQNFKPKGVVAIVANGSSLAMVKIGIISVLLWSCFKIPAVSGQYDAVQSIPLLVWMDLFKRAPNHYVPVN